jgi:hypothetical protein
MKNLNYKWINTLEEWKYAKKEGYEMMIFVAQKDRRGTYIVCMHENYREIFKDVCDCYPEEDNGTLGDAFPIECGEENFLS